MAKVLINPKKVEKQLNDSYDSLEDDEDDSVYRHFLKLKPLNAAGTKFLCQQTHGRTYKQHFKARIPGKFFVLKQIGKGKLGKRTTQVGGAF